MLLHIGAFALLSGCQSARTQTEDKPDYAWLLAESDLVDLTYPFDEQTIYWPTEEKGFVLENIFRGYTDAGYYYVANRFCAPEHGGTHLDAPIHFYEGRQSVDQIPLERLIAEGAVVDVREKALQNRDYQVTVEDLQEWEEMNGETLDGKIVLLRTGYGQFWYDRAQYLGTDKTGPEAVADLHFPGLHPDAARWLVATRSIKAIGIDTPSIDYGQSKTYDTHVTLFEHNIPAFENVANLDRLPEKGLLIVALPMKIKGGSGAPLRIVAWKHKGA